MESSSDISELDQSHIGIDDAYDEALTGHARIDTELQWSLMGEYESFCAAKAGMESSSTNRYRHLRNYKCSDTKRSYVYACSSHSGCTHKMRIVVLTFVSRLERSNAAHSEDTAVTRSRGVHPSLRAEIDSYLKGGFTPLKLEVHLRTIYQHDAAVLLRLPTRQQLAARRKHITKQRGGGWEIETFHTLQEWSADKMCTTRDEFLGSRSPQNYVEFAALDNAYKEQLLVLSVFTGWTSTVGLDGLEQRPYAGVVFTSRQNMWNVAIASKHQKEGVALATDGTYKLHFGGWTLIDIGVVYTRFSNNKFGSSFMPWSYLFVRSECEEAYSQLLRVSAEAFDTFFDYQLDVATCSIDHTQYIQTALKKQWPQVHVVSCAIHMLRNVHKHKSLLRTMDNYKVICTQIHLMRSARTWMQFHAIASVVLMDWETSLAEEEFAQWFQETYLLPPWDVWFFVASLTPGIPAHQQHIESHHKRIKQVCAHELRATTSVVLEHTIPRIVVADAIQPDHTPATWIDAPISGEVLAKALVLLKPRNHRLVEEQSCICFNSSSHFGISITLSRMK
ncbi:hypothetical protein AaE_012390, partial [Aphanomyces astaci]